MKSIQVLVGWYSCTNILHLGSPVKFRLPDQASSPQAEHMPTYHHTSNCMKIFLQLFRTASTVVQLALVKHIPSLFTLSFIQQLLPSCLYLLSRLANWLSSYPAKILKNFVLNLQNNCMAKRKQTRRDMGFRVEDINKRTQNCSEQWFCN